MLIFFFSCSIKLTYPICQTLSFAPKKAKKKDKKRTPAVLPLRGVLLISSFEKKKEKKKCEIQLNPYPPYHYFSFLSQLYSSRCACGCVPPSFCYGTKSLSFLLTSTVVGRRVVLSSRMAGIVQWVSRGVPVSITTGFFFLAMLLG